MRVEARAVAPAFFLASALGVSIASVLLVWAHVLRVGKALPRDAGALVSALRRLPEGERLEELARRAEPSSWPHRLSRAALESSGEAARVAAVNEALGDLERDLEQGALWHRAAARIAAFGGLFIAVVAAVTGQGTSTVVSVLTVAVAGALASVEAGRRAGARAAAQRAVADSLVAVALGGTGTLREPGARAAARPRPGRRRRTLS